MGCALQHHIEPIFCIAARAGEGFGPIIWSLRANRAKNCLDSFPEILHHCLLGRSRRICELHGPVAHISCTGNLSTDVAFSYTHLRAHETPEHLVCRLLLEKK